MPIPYYDSANNRLLDILSEAKAERFVAEGIAHAICSKKGRVLRLYSASRERVYTSAANIHAAANKTVRARRGGDGLLAWEHKRPEGWGWDEACQEACESVCNATAGDRCICSEIHAAFTAGDPAAIRSITGSGSRQRRHPQYI